MKMLWPTYTGLLAFAGMLAAAEAIPAMPAFSAVDKDMDEFLGIEEARAVFPTLTLTDMNGNGYLDKHEAEDALPGLAYTNDTHEDAEERVGAFEYTLMAERYLLALDEILGDEGD